MTERSYRSIGEVLLLLQEEFPDLTISKIRFLESQGLIEPERTASGYRKFYDDDVERLRFVLREQKDHYLPLRVIKDRLEEGTGPLVRPADEVPALRPPAWSVLPSDDEQGSVEPAPAAPAVAEPRPTERDPVEPAAPPPTAPAPAAPAPVEPHPFEPRTFTLDELVVASGLGRAQLRDLEGFGLLSSTEVAGELTYGAEALDVATVAAGLLGHGLEPRHLRMYRQAADREVALFEQVVMPLLKQRHPEARARASADLADLARLGARLREVLVQQELRPHLR